MKGAFDRSSRLPCRDDDQQDRGVWDVGWGSSWFELCAIRLSRGAIHLAPSLPRRFLNPSPVHGNHVSRGFAAEAQESGTFLSADGPCVLLLNGPGRGWWRIGHRHHAGRSSRKLPNRRDPRRIRS